MGLDLSQEVSQGRLICGVACENFVGEGEPLGRDDEGDDDLHAVAPLVARVTELAFVAFGEGRITFEVGAGEIVKQDFEFGVEEGFPPLGEMVEERGFVFEQLVVALVEAMDLG